MFSAGSDRDPYRLTYRHLYGRGFDNRAARTQVSPALTPGEGTAVIVTLGQSLAGNWQNDASPYTPSNAKVENFNIFDGGVYQCGSGPLLGCDGTLGNLFPEMADGLIDDEVYERVILAPMALGASAFNVWLTAAAERITVMARRLEAAGLEATHILYSGGENDAFTGTSQSTCEGQLEGILAAFRAEGIAAPMYVAKETWVNGSQPGGASAVRAAQAAVVDNVDIFAGPDLDTLNNTYRDSTQTHFNAAGRTAAAALWKAAITA